MPYYFSYYSQSLRNGDSNLRKSHSKTITAMTSLFDVIVAFEPGFWSTLALYSKAFAMKNAKKSRI